MWFFEAITKRQDQQNKLLAELLAGQKRIEALLRRFVSPPRPGSVSATLIREESEMLVYKAALPALPDPVGDIVKQRLTVTADGVSALEVDLDITATESPEFKVADNAAVVLSLTYVDDAGNMSAPSEQSFTAADTIAPEAPGAFGEVTLLREE